MGDPVWPRTSIPPAHGQTEQESKKKPRCAPIADWPAVAGSNAAAETQVKCHLVPPPQPSELVWRLQYP